MALEYAKYELMGWSFGNEMRREPGKDARIFQVESHVDGKLPPSRRRRAAYLEGKCHNV
jgi:hypothetical protein